MTLGPITQLGYLPDDLDAAATVWTKIGEGPFTKMAGVTMPATMNGQAVEIKIDLALAYQGDIQIELIKPLCDSPSPYLKNKRAGIWGAHNTQFTVPDLDAAIAQCEAAGMEMACEITRARRAISICWARPDGLNSPRPMRASLCFLAR